MSAPRSPVAFAFALLAAGLAAVPAAEAQGFVDTLREILGPPVEDAAPARQRPRPRSTTPAARAIPATVPVPVARPAEAEAAAPRASEPAEVDIDEAAATPPETPEGKAAEAVLPAVPPLAPPVPQPSPAAESAPESEPPAVPDPAPARETPRAAGPADPAESPDDADPAEEDAAASPEPAEPEPAPEPAYVSPETARTVPEPSAPAVPASEISPAEAAAAAAAIEDARLCETELAARGAAFTTAPSIAEGACGVLRPVQLTRLSSGIAVSPATRMLCRTALALDIWAADGVEAAARDTLVGGTVETIEHASTYVCRDRASERGISEHGRGSAIDIAAFVLADGRRIVVESQPPQSAEDRFLADARRAACGPFKTVLGPGTDADHADHLHLDIAARANGSLYCR